MGKGREREAMVIAGVTDIYRDGTEVGLAWPAAALLRLPWEFYAPEGFSPGTSGSCLHGLARGPHQTLIKN
jgi:hypothetical protein